MRKTADATIALEELAEALGMTTDALKRRYRKLHYDRGLPLPLSYGAGGKNWRWPGLATRLWLANGPSVGRVPSHPAAASHANDNPAQDADFVAQSRAALRTHYGIDR